MPIKAKPNANAYAALRAESKRVKWPEAFKRDLTFHDRRFLGTLPEGSMFLWTLSPTGTHIHALGHRDGARHGPADTVHTIAECWPEARIYVWDGVGLTHYASASLAADRVRELEAQAEEEKLSGRSIYENPTRDGEPDSTEGGWY